MTSLFFRKLWLPALFVLCFLPNLFAQPGPINAWVTLPDRSVLFEEQAETYKFGPGKAGLGCPHRHRRAK
ncbi:MAG: hypothetical protein R2751_00995 [Bacteroidales bacterium]